MVRVDSRKLCIKRHLRVRKKVSGTPNRPRLSVFRSLNHIYTQVIDDVSGSTLLSVSTMDPAIRDSLVGKKKTEQAALVGALIARKALEHGILEVVFDRGGRKYHGRVKALAEAARKEGLVF